MPRYLTPAVTPLKNGKIDFESCQKLYDYLIENGVDGILILGSIGEFFALTMSEKKELIRFANQIIGNRVELIVGTTSMIFDEIVELSNYCYSIGIKKTIVIPPYYFHFSDEEIYRYYDKLAKLLNGDFYLYNFPDRTGYEIPVHIVEKLAIEHKNIIGIKDTISGLDHTREIIKAVKPVRPDFLVYSGFDDNFLHNVMSGGDGCIAGLSNLYPMLTNQWVNSIKNNDLVLANKIQKHIDKLMDIYAVGKPFVPFIKEALHIKGIIDCSEATIPMPMANDEQVNRLKEIMEEFENEEKN